MEENNKPIELGYADTKKPIELGYADIEVDNTENEPSPSAYNIKDEQLIQDKKGREIAKPTAAATKDTRSKLIKSSSPKQDNVFGPDKSQPDFVTELQKVTQPKPKFITPVSVKPPKQDLHPISEYQDKIKKEEKDSFSNYLKEGLDRAISTITQSIYKAPEYAYNFIASNITDPIANTISEAVGGKAVHSDSDKIMETFGIRNIPAEILQERINKSNKIIQDYSNRNGGDPLTAIEKGNYLGAAKLIAGGTIQSFPMMAAAMLSGGSSSALASIAASTAISKAEELKIEHPEMDVQTRTNAGAVSGLLEAYLGEVFTGASGRIVQKILTDKGTKAGSKIISNGLTGMLDSAIEKNPMIGVLGEVFEESGVEYGNQLNEINAGIRKDIDYRSIANAGIIATGMAGTNTTPVYAAKGYMKMVEYNQVKSVNKEINTLTNQLSNPYISDSDKKIISSRVNRLVDENKSIVGNSLEKIKAFPESIKTELNTLNTSLDDLKSKYLELSDNFELPIDVKKAMEQELELQAKELHNRRSNIIEGNYIYEDFKKLSQPEQDRIKLLANETLVADAELNNNPKTSFNDDEINREAVNIYNAEVRAKDIATDIEKTKVASKAIGLSEDIDMPELNTANDVITYLSENTELDDNTIEDIADSYGAFIPLKNGKEALIINKEAASMDQVVTTGQHEFLHKLIYKAVKENPELQKKIGTDLYNHIEDYIGTELFNNTNFKNRYNTYKTDFENTKLELENKVAKAQYYLSKGTISQERYDQAVSEADLAIIKAEGKYLEETLPLLSEALTQGDIKYNETFFTKIGDILRRIFQKYGLSKVKFDTGKDVFNFVRDYNKSFEKGQFTKAFKELAKEGIYKGSIAKVSPTIKTEIKSEVKRSQGLSQVEILKNQLKEIQDNESDYDPDDFDQQVANLQSKIKKAIEKEKTIPVVETKKEISEEDDVKEIIKSEKGKVSSDKVQQIYNEKGLNGADEIIKLFKPITNRIVDKRRDAPGFDRELLTDEIETGKGGILDLIQKYDPKQGTPLAAYINKYLPVRAIATSKRILDQQFKKDVTEEKGLMAEETAIETKEKPKYKNALESKIFPAEVIESGNKKALSVVRTLKSRIDAPVSINRTVTPLITEIKDEMGKLLDIDIKTAMGGKKDKQLEKFLLKGKRYILENMTTTWLMGKDGQGGIPQAIQKQIDNKWVNFPDWVGQKIDREKTTTDLAGRTSGAELVRRLPNVANNISDAEFLAQIIGPDGNPIRGRKESLAKAMSEELAFELIKEDFENDGPILEAFNINQERQGVEITEVIKNEFEKQVDRGNVKFSKASNKATALFLLNEGNWRKDYLPYTQFYKELTTSEKRSLNGFLNGNKSLIDKYEELWERNAGVRYEKYIYLVLRKANKYLANVGLKLEEDVPDRFNSKKNDLVIINIDTGKKTVIELKSSPRDPMGSVSNGNFINNDLSYTKEFVGLKDLKDAQKANPARTKFINYLDQLINENSKDVKLTTRGIQISNNLYKDLDRTGTITNTEIDLQSLSDINPEKDILQIQNYGAFAFPGKPIIGIKPITGKLFASSEFRTNSAGKGWRTLTERVYFYLDPNFNEKTDINLDTDKGAVKVFDAIQNSVKFSKAKKNAITNDAVTESLTSYTKNPKGISVFDFDDTVGLTKSNVLYTMPDGTKGKLNGAEFAKYGSSLLEAGAIFDFSEFSRVVEGKPGPMVEKMKKMIGKFGPDNFFILTARPADSAGPIHQFLSSIGIDIPLENITGLGNSTAQAKADWMTAKAAEGYNDFYFADDHLPNVTAVKNALDILDVKSKIQQAKIKFSKTISPEFNKIISKNTGIGPAIEYSDIVAKRKGAGKNLFDLYVPASAADFELLLYNFIGKGKEGEAQKQFFTDALLKPYANGSDLMDAARQSIKNNYKELINAFPGIAKKLEKLTPDGDFTYDQALRVAMWNNSGVEVPGLSKMDTKRLTSLVNKDAELNMFMQGLITLGRQGNGWTKPGINWDASTIISDLHNLTEGEGRKQFLSEFIANAEEMFGKWENGRLVGPNINKIEAIYGTNVREAIEDVLYRMTTGKNRTQGSDKITNTWLNWVSGSTGTIMFLNTRSAALQLIGAVNFLNLRDNNPIAAAKAFANQKQYWEDFSRIWNSDKMKERRGGLKEDVAAAEIANAAATSKNKPVAVASYLLKIGYTPTQLADSFAIASGGAPFYRNRIKSYLKEGLSQAEAESMAWNDFTKVSDETQQSGDPRDISKQQASGAGRLLLTFQNTAMQQSRIVKKSYLDLKNGRGDAKTHIAKIAYYLTIQNLMFSTLQQCLFAVLPGIDDDEEDDKAKKKKAEEKDKKIISIVDDVIDTIVRGTGLLGGVMVTLKNVINKYMEEKPKEYKADYTKVLLEGVNISPPIGSKAKKIYGALQESKFKKDLIKERGWGIMQDGRVHLGPMYSITGKVAEATVNIPMDRLVNKVENVSQMMNSQNKAWQRIMVGLGWSPRSIGIGDTSGDIAIEEKAMAERKEAGKIKAKETRKAKKDSIANLSPEAYLEYIEEKNTAKNKKKDSIANLEPEDYLDYLEKQKEKRKHYSKAYKATHTFN